MTLPSDLRNYRAPRNLVVAALELAYRCGIVLAATFAFAWAISIAERAA